MTTPSAQHPYGAQNPYGMPPAQNPYGMMPEQAADDAMAASQQGGDWQAQARAAGRDAIAGQASAIVAKLPKWGLSLMGLGALLAVSNIVNALAVIEHFGFFGAYFLVQSPANALQAYGSVVGLVGGAVLLVVGIALNRRRG